MPTAHTNNVHQITVQLILSQAVQQVQLLLVLVLQEQHQPEPLPQNTNADVIRQTATTTQAHHYQSVAQQICLDGSLTQEHTIH